MEEPIGHPFDVYVKVNKIIGEEEVAIKAKDAEIKATKEKGEDTKALEEEVQRLRDKSTDEQAGKHFKRTVDGDQAALDLWKRFRDLSIEQYKRTYAGLNICYSEYSGKSQIKEKPMGNAAKVMQEKGVSKTIDCAVIVDLTKYSKKLGKAVVKKKDGTSLYLTRGYWCHDGKVRQVRI